jgi:uncharacterized protein (DUF4415 family)
LTVNSTRIWSYGNFTEPQEMQAIIVKGGVHQDEDGWWIDDATGELGPDPSILERARPFSEVFPELDASIQRNKVGRPKSNDPKQIVTIRLDRDVLERLKAEGAGWQTRVNTHLWHFVQHQRRKRRRQAIRQ